MRPTSDSIMKSFQNSGKRHIVITGSIGHGKSLLKKELVSLIDPQQSSLPGIKTYLIPGECVMLCNNLTGEDTKIGQMVKDESGFIRMQSVPDGFSTLGVQAAKEAQESISEWVSIDEIGFLESKEKVFQDAIRCLFEKKHVLCVIRKQDIPFLNELKNRQDVYLVDVDDTYIKVGCVIMASGQGKRFGSNKLLAHFQGKPLYQRTFELADRRLFDKIVVVTRTKEVYEKALELEIDAVYHDMTDRNDVVRLGVEQMKEMNACVFCPCDQPLLKKESLEHLVDAFCSGDKGILRLSWNDEPGTPILFSDKYFSELMSLPEKKGGSYIAEKYKEDIRYIPVSDKNELKDIDTREDLEMLLTM